MIAFFAFMDRVGMKKGSRDPLMVYFALFSLSLAGYVFFDNSLALLLFNEFIVTRITTPGVAVCAFGLMISYSGMITQIFDLPRRNRLWFRICVILGLLSLTCSMTVFLHGWEWYMAHFDAPAIALYIIIFIVIEVRVFTAIRKRHDRLKYAALLLVSVHVMVFSLFFWRVLININTAYFFVNNSILLGAMALFFPLVMSLHRSETYRELQRLRNDEDMRARIAEQSLRELFFAQEGTAPRLTDRELEVCEALLEGLEYKEIQNRTGLSLSGVKKRVHFLYRKFGIQNRTELYNRIQEMRNSMASV